MNKYQEYQEALKELKDFIHSELDGTRMLDEYLKYCDTFQELVDKEKPKKPYKQFGNNGYCSKCHYLIHSFYEYCCWCGQKLDWSDEDDN